MTWYRLKFYLFGLLMGLFVLAAMGKFNSCKTPGTLKRQELAMQKREFSTQAECLMQCQHIDTATINKLFKDGDMLFSESSPREKPCGIYIMEGKSHQNETLRLTILDCENTTKITEVKVMGKTITCQCN